MKREDVRLQVHFILPYDGKHYFALHSPNNHPMERACFYEIEKEDGSYHLK